MTSVEVTGTGKPEVESPMPDCTEQKAEWNVTAIVIGLALTVVVAVAVVIFTAYPSRGRQVPKAAWVNTAVERLTHRLPAEVAEEFVRPEPSHRS
jgi:hypothetical protein